MPSTIRASPIRPWAGCGPRTSAWSSEQLEAVLGDDEVDVGAGGYDIGARARQIRDDLLSLAHPATEADMLAIQLDSRALFLARWRDLLLALIDEDAMARRTAAPRVSRAGQRRRDRSQRRCRGLSPGAHLSRQHAECVVAQPRHRVVRCEVSKMRRPGQFEAAGWRLVSEQPTGDRAAGWRRLARVPAAAARRHHRRVDEGLRHARRLQIRRVGPGRRAPSAVARRAAAVEAARHANTAAGRRSPHAARAGRLLRRVGAFRGFAGPRERMDTSSCPAGPSGHPLSPFYRSGFDDWAAGTPTPFLPGPAAHKLLLRPDGAATP